MNRVFFKGAAGLAAAALAVCALVFWVETGSPEPAADIDPPQIKAGDFVYFGRYPQSELGTAVPPAGAEKTDWVKANDVQNEDMLTYYAVEPIVWRVLEADDGLLFLLSENILDCRPYNTLLPCVDWKDCTIRKWLNDTTAGDSFMRAAFRADERAAICQTDNSPDNETDGGGVMDQIFFLSFDEADRYFAENADRIATNTSYSAAACSLHAEYWWIRTPPGGLTGYAAYVSDYGKAYTGGHHVFYTLGVRPALRLDMTALSFVSGDGTPDHPYSVDDAYAP